MMRTDELSQMFEVWDSTDHEPVFVRYLTQHGWTEHLTRGYGRGWTMKRTFVKDGLILKWDGAYTSGYLGRAKLKNTHTREEMLSWVRSRGMRKEYIAPMIAWHNGLLVQARLQDVCDDYDCPHAEARRIATRFRFSHWWHHGTLGGKLRFFDTDSAGSGWSNWKQKAQR